MNPNKTYNAIITYAKSRDPNTLEFGHWHHIIPRCMGGDDSLDNLVRLTYKEHYFCHYLLFKANPDNCKLALAYKWMSTNGKYGDKIISMKMYERACKLNAQMVKDKIESGEIFGWSELWKLPEFREKMSKTASLTMTEKNKDPCIISLANRSKQLNHLWKYFSENGILNPTDEQILIGAVTPKGDVLGTWVNWFTKDEWLTSVHNYLSDHPIVKTERVTRVINMENQSKSRIKNTFYKNLVSQKFGVVTSLMDVTDEIIIKASWYNPVRRCWNVSKWRDYWTESEWIQEIRLLLETKNFESDINEYMLTISSLS